MWLRLNLSAIEAALHLHVPFVEITKFPSRSAVTLPFSSKAESRTHQEVVDAIQAAGVKRLTDIKLFDVFSGEKTGSWHEVNGL